MELIDTNRDLAASGSKRGSDSSLEKLSNYTFSQTLSPPVKENKDPGNFSFSDEKLLAPRVVKSGFQLIKMNTILEDRLSD